MVRGRAPEQILFGRSPTNVWELALRVAKTDGAVPQVTWYDQGVGTGDLLDRVQGGLFGSGLDENVFEAYRFLVSNYVPGDEIHLFGFSRGAYTVRSLAGMIRKCGIVRSELLNYANALDLYRNHEHPDAPGPTNFRAKFSVSEDPIPIQCVGVWETVGSLGIPLRPLSKLTQRRYQFHDTELSKTVKHAYHALAIDEHREPFTPTLWRFEPKDGQVLEQVWFSGSHSDVGGGYGSGGLPAITLEWMMGKAKAAGLAFDGTVATAQPPAPDPLAPMNRIEGSRLWNPLRSVRPIGVRLDANGKSVLDRTQSLHPSVLQRWDEMPTYRPANLRLYLSSKGDDRAKPPGRRRAGDWLRSLL